MCCSPFLQRMWRVMRKIFHTTVSVKDGTSRNVLRGIVQYDTLNEVNIRLFDGSKAFNYEGYTNIIFRVLKPDGTAYIDSEGENVIATAPLSGIVTVILKGQATVAAGVCQGVIEIYSGNERMTSARLNYEVFSALNTHETTEVENQYPVFQRLLSDLSELEATIELAESIRRAAETAWMEREEADAVCVNWSSQIEFKKGNKAVYKGSTYLCLKDCTGVAPTDEACWLLIAQRGNNGVVISIDADRIAFEIDGDGHLILVYEDGSSPPRMELGDDGHLYVVVE